MVPAALGVVAAVFAPLPTIHAGAHPPSDLTPSVLTTYDQLFTDHQPTSKNSRRE